MAPKVPAKAADIPVMKPDKDASPEPNHEVFRQALAISLAVRAIRAIRTIRKAQGKTNPGDLAIDSAGWLSAFDDFAHDLLRALAAEVNTRVLTGGADRDSDGSNSEERTSREARHVRARCF